MRITDNFKMVLIPMVYIALILNKNTSGSIILRNPKFGFPPKNNILEYPPFPRSSYASSMNYPPIRKKYTTTPNSITSSEELFTQTTSQSLENRLEITEDIVPSINQTRPSIILEYKPESRPSFASSSFAYPLQLKKNYSSNVSPAEIASKQLPEQSVITINSPVSNLSTAETQLINNRLDYKETKPSANSIKQSIVLEYNPFPRPSFAPNPVQYPPLLAKYTTTQASTTINQKLTRQTTSPSSSTTQSETIENRFDNKEKVTSTNKTQPSIILEYNPDPRPSFAPSPFIYPPELKRNISTTISPIETTSQKLFEQSTTTSPSSNSSVTSIEPLENRFDNVENNLSVIAPRPSIILEYKPFPRPSFAPNPIQYPPLLAKYTTTTQASTQNTQDYTSFTTNTSTTQSQLIESNENINSLNKTRPSIILEYNPDPRPSFAPSPFIYPPELKKNVSTTVSPAQLTGEKQSTLVTSSPSGNLSTSETQPLNNFFDNEEAKPSDSLTRPSISLEYNPFPRPSFAPSPVHYPPLLSKYTTTTQEPTENNQELSAQSPNSTVESQTFDNRFNPEDGNLTQNQPIDSKHPEEVIFSNNSISGNLSIPASVSSENKTSPSIVLEYKPDPRPSFAPSPFIYPPELKKNVSTTMFPSDLTSEKQSTLVTSSPNDNLSTSETQPLNNCFDNEEAKPSDNLTRPSISLEYKPFPRPSFAPSPIQYPPLLNKYTTTTQEPTENNQELSAQSPNSTVESQTFNNHFNLEDGNLTQNQPIDSKHPEENIVANNSISGNLSIPASVSSENKTSSNIVLEYKPNPRPSFAPSPFVYPPELKKNVSTTISPIETMETITITTNFPSDNLTVVNNTKPSIVLGYNPDPRPSFGPSPFVYPPELKKNVSATISPVETTTITTNSPSDNLTLVKNTKPSIVLGYNPDPRPSFGPSPIEYPPELHRNMSTTMASIVKTSAEVSEQSIDTTISPNKNLTMCESQSLANNNITENKSVSTSEQNPSIVLEYKPDSRPSFDPAPFIYPLQLKKNVSTTSPTELNAFIFTNESGDRFDKDNIVTSKEGRQDSSPFSIDVPVTDYRIELNIDPFDPTPSNEHTSTISSRVESMEDNDRIVFPNTN